MNHNVFINKIFDELPEEIVCSNFFNCIINASTHFERCNLVKCTINSVCTYDRTNIIDDEEEPEYNGTSEE